jgi:hypothetical protein
MLVRSLLRDEREREMKTKELVWTLFCFLSCFPLGLAVDRCVSLCPDSIHCHEYWNILHRLSCVLSTTARVSFASCQSESRAGHNTEQSQGSILSSVHIESTLFRDPDKELAYPRVKAIIYLMQFCNHSLNFIFYGSSVALDCQASSVRSVSLF